MNGNAQRLSAFTLVLAACVSGCIPEALVWLPESSGFLYIRNDGALVHIDLKTKTPRVICTLDWLDNKRNNGCPAVSPDGKQVAVVRNTRSPSSSTVEVLCYDMAGNVRHTSKPIPVPKPDTVVGQFVRTLAAFWSPSGRHIVFTDHFLNGFGLYSGPSTSILGVYDIETQRFRLLHGLDPVIHPMIRQFVFTPKDSGFLCSRPDSGEVVFVDWSGWEHAVESNPVVEELNPLMRDARIAPAGLWSDDTYEVRCLQGRLSLDLSKRELTYRNDAGQRLLWDYARKNDVMIIAQLRDQRVIQVQSTKGEKKGFTDVVLAIPSQRRSRLLVRTGGEPVLTVPSPGKGHAIVFCKVPGKGAVMVVFDSEGDIGMMLPDNRISPK